MEIVLALIVVAVVIVAIVIVYLKTRKKGEKVEQHLKPVVSNQEPEEKQDVLVKPFPQDKMDGNSTPEEKPKEEVIPSDAPLPKPDKDSEKEVDADLKLVLEDFEDYVTEEKHPKTCAYLRELVREAYYQVYKRKSFNGLPYLYRRENFPTVYDYFNGKEEPQENTTAYFEMLMWIVAMQLSELIPTKRNDLYKIGYDTPMNLDIFGYSFHSDPNVARLVGSAIYSTMRTVCQPDIEAMRKEVGGSKYASSLEKILDDEPRTNVKDGDFYVDLRMFMASAPGPYAPNYKDRSKNNPTFSDEKASNGCLQMDMDIYNHYVGTHNLDEQRAVQAIADEDGDLHHLFGNDMKGVGGKYDFNAVFGLNDIGLEIDPESSIASLVKLAQCAGGSQRGILQHANSNLGAIEYGRLRPACSEEQECKRKSYTDDRLNVLTKFVIEDNDGHKETYTQGNIEVPYYDENGHWTKKSVQSEEDYENMMKDSLYANSYPSGHSSGIWSAAMTLMEIYPKKADLIMKAANDFANSRAVARFHWTSDTIQGRVVGSVINPICHATDDYDNLIYRCIQQACC